MAHATLEILKERFSLERGEAEHILGSFVDSVENSLEEYGICHVAGVGSFVRAPGDRRISFDPAESLTRAANVRFADLPVYEVDRSVTSGETPRSPVRSTPPLPTAQPPSTGPEPPRPPRTASAEPRLSDASGEPEEASVDSPVPAPETPPEEREPVVQAPDTASADGAGSPRNPSLAGRRRSRSGRGGSAGGRRAAWFALPVFIALIAATVWFIQRPSSEQEPVARETPPATAERETPPENGTTTPEDAETVQDDPVSGDPTDTDAPAEVEPPASQQATDATADPLPDYALDRSVDGYTLIVGSSPDRGAATGQLSRFTELDLPFGVLDYSEDGSSMYRLAVGLYDSAEQADSARQAMSGVLPSGTWVWRIR